MPKKQADHCSKFGDVAKRVIDQIKLGRKVASVTNGYDGPAFAFLLYVLLRVDRQRSPWGCVRIVAGINPNKGPGGRISKSSTIALSAQPRH